MSKLEELMEEYCPNGVEYKTIDNISKVLRGKRLTKNLLIESGDYPVFHGGLSPLGYYDESNREANTTMVINVGASAGTVGFSSVEFWSSDGCYCIEHSPHVISRYLYYALICQEEHIKSRVRYAGIPTLDAKVVEKLVIPVPPLEVQSEIVRILDNFTELTAELTAELTMRKQQYEYYRDSLLTFGDEVPHLPMGNEKLGIFIRGGSFQKKDFLEEGIGCIHYGQIFTYYKTYANETKTFINEELARKCRKAQNGNLIIATTSENDEDVCKAVTWLGNEEIAISSDACIYKHHMNPKYVSYFFQTEQFQSQKRQYITGTKVRRVNADNLAKILIPIPPIEEQERIVDILDKFDTLTNSISEGLPYEIELRKKQYEYYRDKLLTFKRLEV
jgi:type I restriction enzyme S subunit